MPSPWAQVLAADSISPFSWLPTPVKAHGCWWGTETILWTRSSCFQKKEEMIALFREVLPLPWGELVYGICSLNNCEGWEGAFVPEPSKSCFILYLPRDLLNLQRVSERSCAVELKSHPRVSIRVAIGITQAWWVLSRTPDPSSIRDLVDSEVMGEETLGLPGAWGCLWKLPSIGCHLWSACRRGNLSGTAKIKEDFLD